MYVWVAIQGAIAGFLGIVIFPKMGIGFYIWCAFWLMVIWTYNW